MKDGKAGKIRRIVVEPSDNGGFICRVERQEAPRKTNMCCMERPDDRSVHTDVQALTGYLASLFPGKAASKGRAKPAPAAWAEVGNKMLGRS